MSTPAEPRWWGNHLAEVRWQAEAARLLVDPVFRGVGVPRGDGRAVVLLPGFLAGDYTLQVLRDWLRRMGWRPAVSGFRANLDCSARALRCVEECVERHHAATGRRVAVVGHSRGGHFARAIGALRPDLVSHAVSLGGGLGRQQDISVPTQAAVALVRAATGGRRAMPCFSESCECSFGTAYRAPWPQDVRLTSIYSRGDGVVRWRSCLVEEAECVEVGGSHVGLITNRAVFRALAGALARPELP
jgi:pimeloyl-ACP methyl ester carboxylesterase